MFDISNLYFLGICQKKQKKKKFHHSREEDILTFQFTRQLM